MAARDGKSCSPGVYHSRSQPEQQHHHHHHDRHLNSYTIRLLIHRSCRQFCARAPTSAPMKTDSDDALARTFLAQQLNWTRRQIDENRTNGTAHALHGHQIRPHPGFKLNNHVDAFRRLPFVWLSSMMSLWTRICFTKHSHWHQSRAAIVFVGRR